MTVGRLLSLIVLVVATALATWWLFRAERDLAATPEGYLAQVAKDLRSDNALSAASNSTSEDFSCQLLSGRRLQRLEVLAWVDREVKAGRFHPGVAHTVAMPGVDGSFEVLVTGTLTEGDLKSTVHPPLSAFRAAVSLVPHETRFRIRAIRFLN